MKTNPEVCTIRVKEKLKNITAVRVVEYAMYVVGVVFLAFAIYYYCSDLLLKFDGDEYDFYEKKYVTVDAYNYIISATRSSTVMIKSLILALTGFATIIIGQLMAILNRKS